MRRPWTTCRPLELRGSSLDCCGSSSSALDCRVDELDFFGFAATITSSSAAAALLLRLLLLLLLLRLLLLALLAG